MNLEEIQQNMHLILCPLREQEIETSFAYIKKFGYEFKSILGYECFGIVILAIKKDINEVVAIKISKLNEDLSRSILVTKFWKLYGNINQFPQYYESFYDESTSLCFFVQKYCKIGNLKTYLEKNPLLSKYEKIKLFIQILKGINTLHEAEIVYADLNPENIFISDEYNALLSNFGALCQKSQSELLASGFARTRAYCPPEQIQYHALVELDFYSAGAILFFILGERCDFSFQQMKSGVYPDRNQYLYKDLYDIAKSMMSIDPKQRSTSDQIIPQLRLIMISENSNQKTQTTIPDEDEQSQSMQSEMPSEILDKMQKQFSNYEKSTMEIKKKSDDCFEITQFYQNNRKKFQGNFKNGKPHGVVFRYYSNGNNLDKRLYRDGLENGDVEEYYENGNRKLYGTFKNGKYHGHIIHYFENGDRKTNGIYEEGKKHGEVREYFENNILKSRCLYMMGKKHGQFEEYNENEQIIKQGCYEEGREQGQITCFHDNQKKKSQYIYIQGKLNGEAQTFDENAILRTIRTYKDGILLKEQIF